MKAALLSFGMLLITNSLLANCPELAGTYQCQDQSGAEEVSLSQSQTNGITSYILTAEGVSQTLVANGQKQVIKWGEEEPAEMTISCENNKLKMYIHGFEQLAPGASGQFYMSPTAAGFNVDVEITIPGQTQKEVVSVCSRK
jgi:hypothetical protein